MSDCQTLEWLLGSFLLLPGDQPAFPRPHGESGGRPARLAEQREAAPREKNDFPKIAEEWDGLEKVVRATYLGR